MVASRKVEFPFCRGIGQQRGREFAALAQVIGKTAIPFRGKYIDPAAKLVSADFLEFAVPEFADVATGRKSFKTAAKSVREQTLRKRLGGGSTKTTASRVLPRKSPN